MKKSITTSITKQEENLTNLQKSIGEIMQDGMIEYVMQAGIESILELIEEEVTEKCGKRYANLAGKICYRWGKTNTAMVLGGKKVLVRRSRVRAKNKTGEVSLQTIEALQDEELLSDRQLEQMLLGVSTRKYSRSLEAVPANNKTFSCKKSSISRRFVIKSRQKLTEWQNSTITDEYPILLIDATIFKTRAVIIAMGIKLNGEKQVLGTWNGSTENYEVCKDLLTNLIERKLDPKKIRVAILDGGKAIRKALDNVLGQHILVQRCQFHKVQNVMGYLSDEMKPSVRQSMQEAYAAKEYDTAVRLLENLSRSLARSNEQAARSLKEGMYETLTLQKLGITGKLKRSLVTTNMIENLNSRIKDHCRRVRRWRNPNMIIRWVYTGIAEAEKGFRRINGCKDIEKLVMLIDLKQNNPEENLDRKDEAA